MKVYTKVVFDIKTMEVVSSESYEYDGEVAHCGGGGGETTTTTVDPVYNAGMLALSEEQQGWAEQMYNQFMYGVGYDPNEQVTGYYDDSGNFVQAEETDLQEYYESDPNVHYDAGSGHWIDHQGNWVDPPTYTNVQGQELVTTTLGEVEGYDPSAVTSEMEYMQSQVEANQQLLGTQTEATQAGLDYQIAQTASQQALLPMQQQATEAQLQSTIDLEPAQTDLALAEIASQSELLPLTTDLARQQIGLEGEQIGLESERIGLASNVLSDLKTGIDVGERMDQAQAGVQHGYKTAGETMRRNIASYGLDPSSGRYAAMNREMGLSEAAGIAGARTAAKQTAETEDFNRKMQGLSVI